MKMVKTILFFFSLTIWGCLNKDAPNILINSCGLKKTISKFKHNDSIYGKQKTEFISLSVNSTGKDTFINLNSSRYLLPEYYQGYGLIGEDTIHLYFEGPDTLPHLFTVLKNIPIPNAPIYIDAHGYAELHRIKNGVVDTFEIEAVKIDTTIVRDTVYIKGFD